MGSAEIIRNFRLKEKTPEKKNKAATFNKKDALLLEKLKESEVRYRRLFESAKDGILILDFESGNIVDANPFIVDMIGFPKEEIVGRKLWEIGLFSNIEDSERAFNELRVNGYIRFEDMPIPRRNGKISEVEFISNVYFAGNTKVIQCNIRDITERKQAELKIQQSDKILEKQNRDYQQLNREYLTVNEDLRESLNQIQIMNAELIIAKVKAEESDNLKSAFLANMSHEIRTPMNAIMGFSKILLQPGLSKTKAKNFVHIINTSSLQLLSIINDILDISKIDANQITIDSQWINVNDLLRELYVTYTKLVKPKKLKLKYTGDAPEKHIRLKTDGNRIKQVLCNLLDNAIKYTDEGVIEFGYKITQNNISFFVKDSGIGISKDNHEMIFHRFSQVATQSKQIYSGNGLGLSISKALVERLGGVFSVDSALGYGSTFTFTFPYKKETDHTNTNAKKTKSTMTKNWADKLILLVEDDVNNHTYMAVLLATTSAKVVHAWNGVEAVEQVKKNPGISLVLMDIKMPLMDGYSATRLIKKIRPKLPIIAQTAFAQNQDKENAFEAGCDSYISKPAPKDDLLKLMGNFLN
jgi:PAS domain S-box-containing protein